jgi:hypothetical protein
MGWNDKYIGKKSIIDFINIVEILNHGYLRLTTALYKGCGYWFIDTYPHPTFEWPPGIIALPEISSPTHVQTDHCSFEENFTNWVVFRR